MRAKVWNDNDLDVNDKFKGDPIHIPAHGFIEMDFYDGNQYRGQFVPPLMENGVQNPKSMKKIRVEKIESGSEDPQTVHACMQCKKTYESEPVLKAHIETEHADAARLEIPEVDEEIKTRGRPKKAS